MTFGFGAEAGPNIAASLARRQQLPGQQLLQGKGQFVPRLPGRLFHEEDVGLIGMRVALGFPRSSQTGEILQGLGVATGQRLPLPDQLINLAQLNEADGCLQVSHSVVEA